MSEQDGILEQKDDELDLEAILKEFHDDGEPTEETPLLEEAVQATADAVVPEPESAVAADTVRLDDISAALRENANSFAGAVQITEEEPEPPAGAEPFSAEWEPEYEQPMGDYVPPEPIVFQPKSRLRELKKKLVAGPEKRYYEISEQGVGKLQIGIFLNLLLVLLSVGSTVMYAGGMVPENRMKLVIFLQVLVLLLAGLLGSYRLLEGWGDLLRKRFSLNTMLALTFLACCVDGIFCLMETKVPCCAAFSLEMLMCQWGTYQKRVTELGQMDTLRKAILLDGVASVPNYYEGRPGFLTKQGQVEDFMDSYAEVSGPEKALNLYALIALAVSAGVGLTAGTLHGIVLGVRSFAAALLAAVPVSMFVTLSRPMAILERRLHKLGAVICGWRGVKELSVTAAYPLGDLDLFPLGSTKLNGVKFYGSRDPDEVVAYATSLIRAGGGGLVPLFDQLLESRSGYHYEVDNLQCYGNGGIGGEVMDEPVLVGALSFLQDMGVDMPEGTKVNQAVYVAIDGQLCGVFAITYGRTKSSASGLNTLCGYRGLTPVLIAGDFMLTDSFLRSKFGVNTRRMAFPPRTERMALAEKLPEEQPCLALMTREGMACAAFAVTGARALKTASLVGTAVHLAGGALGLAMMLTLAVLGAEDLLTPVNLLLYELIWLVPGLLITEWTRSI